MGAGTVEYLLSRDGKLSFLEVNTRLQVEHPVLKKLQKSIWSLNKFAWLKVKCFLLKETPKAQGHAIEFRINAEDPARGFIPAFGVLSLFEAPFGHGVRVDTGVRTRVVSV